MWYWQKQTNKSVKKNYVRSNTRHERCATSLRSVAYHFWFIAHISNLSVNNLLLTGVYSVISSQTDTNSIPVVVSKVGQMLSLTSLTSQRQVVTGRVCRTGELGIWGMCFLSGYHGSHSISMSPITCPHMTQHGSHFAKGLWIRSWTFVNIILRMILLPDIKGHNFAQATTTEVWGNVQNFVLI